jgi:penicillin-binding protein 1A
MITLRDRAQAELEDARLCTVQRSEPRTRRRWRVWSAGGRGLQFIIAIVTGRVRSAWSRRVVRFLCPTLVLLILLPAAGLAYHVYLDRSNLPDLEPFIRFAPPRIGRVYDMRGRVLIELAREYRRLISYDEIPMILRQAILAAEDKNFFSHSGVEYRALPRVIQKMSGRSLVAWWKGAPGVWLRFPQGGSTLTQQLVRGYFLQDRTSSEDGNALFRAGWTPRIFAAGLGVPATNKLFRKLEEVRLTLWLEREMRRRYGSRERAKREIFVRYANFLYLGNGRYGFAAAAEYYFGKPLSSYTPEDAGRAALLAGITKSPRNYAPVPGDPRPLRRRNQILALMARNGYISEGLARRCQAEPVCISAYSPLETHAPAAIDGVFDELRAQGGDRFGVEDLVEGRIVVRSTIDERVQTVVTEALENGLGLYEQRHPGAKGLIQGSVVVLGNASGAILAEAGGRRVYQDHQARHSDYNRATQSLRQPGSAWKPLVYLAAFRAGMNLDTTVLDEPIALPMGGDRGLKWIANYDGRFKGPIPLRLALAESRNAVAVRITQEIGLDTVFQTAREMGIRTPIQPYATTALGASEVHLLELAGAYRAMASGVAADPHVIDRVEDGAGKVIYQALRTRRDIQFSGLSLIQEGLRGVIRLPSGTGHSLDRRNFPIPVMGKTGTTSNFRDALFVGSTFGRRGITVAVWIGFDDNRPLGEKETGGRAALPIFREIMLRVYKEQMVGPVPRFPHEIEHAIDTYLTIEAVLAGGSPDPPAVRAGDSTGLPAVARPTPVPASKQFQ